MARTAHVNAELGSGPRPDAHTRRERVGERGGGVGRALWESWVPSGRPPVPAGPTCGERGGGRVRRGAPRVNGRYCRFIGTITQHLVPKYPRLLDFSRYIAIPRPFCGIEAQELSRRPHLRRARERAFGSRKDQQDGVDAGDSRRLWRCSGRQAGCAPGRAPCGGPDWGCLRRAPDGAALD